MAQHKEIITTIICSIVVAITSIAAAIIAREKITKYEVREISTSYDLAKIGKYYPLNKGNYWIYEGRVITVDGNNKPLEKRVKIKMQVIESYENINNKGIRLFVMSGHPSDVAKFIVGKGNEKVVGPSKYGYLLIANKIYSVCESEVNEAITRIKDGKSFVNQSNASDDTEKHAILDECEFEFPLFKGQRYGDKEQLTRSDYRYFWYVNDFMNYKYAANGIINEYPQYKISYLTIPDSVQIDFAPYLGITSYEYSHTGSRMEAHVDLADYKIN